MKNDVDNDAETSFMRTSTTFDSAKRGGKRKERKEKGQRELCKS